MDGPRLGVSEIQGKSAEHRSAWGKLGSFEPSDAGVPSLDGARLNNRCVRQAFPARFDHDAHPDPIRRNEVEPVKGGILLAVCAVFDLLGVVMGYEGIARLRKFRFPPFQHPEGLFKIYSPVPVPPDWLILAWNSWWGTAFLWSGCLLFPLGAAYAVARKRPLTAIGLMLAWTLLGGGAGLWIWIHAALNATDLSQPPAGE